MRKITATLALALCLLGCAAVVELAPSSEPVKLQTYSLVGVQACCIPCIAGPLVPDEATGTAIRVEAAAGDFGGCGVRPDSGMGRSPEVTRTEPVTWPVGYTGRRVGSVVEILNTKGEVVARTGERYVCQQEAASKAYICDTGE
jgi:hypothetical protein